MMKLSEMSNRRKADLAMIIIRYLSAMLLIWYAIVGKPVLVLFALVGLHQVLATYQMDKAIELRKEPKKKVKHVRKAKKVET